MTAGATLVVTSPGKPVPTAAAAACSGKCDLPLSADMRDGVVWRGVMVANQLAPTQHPLLADALRH